MDSIVFDDDFIKKQQAIFDEEDDTWEQELKAMQQKRLQQSIENSKKDAKQQTKELLQDLRKIADIIDTQQKDNDGRK